MISQVVVAQSESEPTDKELLPVALELGAARGFNGFFLESFQALASHAEGRLAAGGDVSIDDYSVAEKLNAASPGTTLLVGGDLQFPIGRVHQGDIVVGGSAAGVDDAVLNNLDENQALFDNAELPFDFAAQFTTIRHTSRVLAAQPPNGTVESESGSLRLAGDCSSPAQVFQLGGQQLLEAQAFEVSCLPEGATVIFNISGARAGLANISLESLAAHRANVLFNFFEAADLVLAGVDVQGSILAPLAHVEQPQGVIDGTIIARSWNGPMLLNHQPFRGTGAGDFCALYPLALPFDLLDGAEPGSEFQQIPRGTGQGNFSWLTWAGDPSAPVLANSLVPPGDSFIYINPDDDSDWRLTPGDWAQGAPGAMNSNGIRDNLDALLGTEIIVPVWSELRGQGNNFDYQAIDFASVRLLDYRLPGNGWLTFEFLGFSNCYNRAPEAFDQQLEAEADTPLDIELAGQDPNGDELMFEITTPPANGELIGEPPLVQYLPEPGFVGEDSFEFIALDDYLASPTARVTIQVIRNNLPPEIVSEAVTEATQEIPYTYSVEAVDPNEGDVLSWDLIQRPSEMTVDPLTGLIEWIPGAEFVGHHSGQNSACFVSGDQLAADSGAADVVVVVDESGSMSGEHDWIPLFVQGLESHLQANEVGANEIANLYGLIGYERAPRAITVGDDLMGDFEALRRAASQLRTFGGVEDGWRAIRHALIEYPLRANAAANVVLITDEGRNAVNTEITFDSLLNELQDTGAIVNAVVNARFACADSSGNTVAALGIDANGTGYLADGQGGFLTCDEAKAVSGSSNTIPAYVDLALATGGAAWDLNFLRAGGSDAISFANALIDIKIREILEQLPPQPRTDVSIDRLYWADGDIRAEVVNRGVADTEAPSMLQVFVDQQLLLEQAVPPLAAGERHVAAIASDVRQHEGPVLRAVLVPGNPESECNAENHELTAPVVTIRATDTGGLFDEQTYSISVAQVAAPPEFVSTPIVEASVGARYQYQAQAVDSNTGDALIYSLVTSPAGMTIDSFNGRIRFEPNLAQQGSHTVVIQVEDLDGLTARQEFELTVDSAFVFPRFTSQPPLRVVENAMYEYQATAAADPLATLEFDLVIAPPGLEIDPKSGLVHWSVPGDVAGSRIPVSIRVRDQFGNFDLQIFELLGDTPNEPPRISTTPVRTADLTRNYSYSARVQDPNFYEEHAWSITSGPTGMVIDSELGRVIWPGSSVSAGRPEGDRQNNPFCLVRSEPDGELTGREVWRWSGGLPRFTQPLVVPLLLDKSLGSPELEDLQLAIGITSSGGGINGRALHALNLENGDLLWSHNTQVPLWGVSPASADLDGNGVPDIVFVDEQQHLVAVDSFGQLSWISNQPVAVPGANLNEAAVVIADLDADGRQEIIVGSTVFDAAGNLRWEFPGAADWGAEAFRATPLVVDLNGDGRLEIVMFDQVRNADGDLLWTVPLEVGEVPRRAHFGAGDLDSDGSPDLAVSLTSNIGRALLAVSGDGSLLWSDRSSRVQRVSSPLLADFTRDGHTDIFLPGGAVLFDDIGDVIWQRPGSITARDFRTAIAADMSADGWLEIVMHGGSSVFVLSGLHGEVLASHAWSEPSNRFGIVPVLVQPDGFARPRLLMGGNAGLLVMQPALDGWPTLATSFTQVEFAPASPRHEFLRILQPPVRSVPATTFLPDLHIEAPSALPRESGQRIETVIRNRGTAPVEGGFRVAFYRGNPESGGVLLREQVIEQSLVSGQTVVVGEEGLANEELGDEIFARVEALDASLIECENGNNVASGVTASIRVEDHGGLHDSQFWAIGVREWRVRPTFTSSPPVDAVENEPYTYQAAAMDPNLGDVVEYRLISGPQEARLHPLTGELHWTPRWGQTGNFQFRIDVRDLSNLIQPQFFTVTVAESSVPNEPPVIHSQPVTQVQLGERYQYQVLAEDPDDQELVFELLEAPEGMSMHPRTGLVTWDPLAIEDAPVTLQVRDERGAATEQSFTIRIDLNPNQPPQIASAPPLAVNLGETWSYAIEAFDPDGDPVELLLVISPAGASFDNGDVAAWQPTSDQLGEQAFVIEARDGRGGVARQQFTVLVNDPAVNQPPQITSMPPTSATVGVELVYAVQASDPDGDTLSFALGDQPAGAGIDSSSGKLSWTPSDDQTGEQAFEIRVTDGNGGLALQRFTVSVQPAAAENRPPEIVSTPPAGAKTGREYGYDMVVVDPDGDPLTFTLAEVPEGMSIDGVTGQLRWTPDQVGSVSVRVEVGDGEFTVFQQWQIEVLDGTVPLSLELAISPEFPEIGQVVQIQLLPEAASGQVATEVTVNGQSVPVDPDLIARFVPSEAGEHTVLGMIDDGFEQATAEATFFASDPDVGDGPVVTLFSPDFEAEITAPAQVRGAVQGAGLVRWVLAYTEAGTQDWVFLAEGTDAFDPTDIARFDPSLLLNGQYRIALQAWDNQGRSGVDSRIIRVTGDMKVGHFSITFEDLSIPVSGIPITVTRTYDTRQRHQPLDFGHGWSIDYQNVRVQESRRLGLGWEIVEFRSGPFGAFVEMCVLPQGEPLVTVTLPDGSVETFEVHVKNECNDFVAVIDFLEFDFQPIDGTLSTLTESDFSGSMRLVNGNLVENGTFSIIADPTNYTLTTKEGFVFELDQNFGIRTVTDPNDNTLTYTDDGILHSSGKSIVFNRDASGRITDIVDPMGNVLSYTYDGAGDLTAFADREEQITQFGYLSGHFLEDIIDPRGVRAIRNEYDEDGRLIAQIDADGNRIEFTHDIEGRLEIVKDRRGNSTVHVYDDHGNVISETNALGETTLRTYDDFGNELTRTDPLGNVWSAKFDEDFNQIEDTNPLGETNASSYNEQGLLVEQTAPDGTVILSNQYDGRDNPTAITDALGQTTAFDYAFFGLLTTITDARGQETEFFYDSFGNIARQVDPNGTETRFTYDDNGNVLTETVTRTNTDGEAEDLVTTNEYDANGNRIKTTDPLGAVRTTEYNEADQVVAEIDPLGRRTEFEYDNRGNQVLTRFPDGTTETSEFGPEGNLIAETDRAGRTTKMVYDAADRLVETILPDDTPGDDSDNPRMRNVYDAAGNVTEEIDERGNRTQHEYDAAGRRTKTIDALGNETNFEYDVRGQNIATIDARGNRTEFEYDAAGRRTATVFADGTRTTTEYDALGRKIAETDQAGRTTRFEYDPVGNLAAVIDPLDQRTEYEYDEQSNRTVQRDALGRETRWAYDPAGRVLSRTLPLGQTETFAYDAVGNQISRTDFNGAISTFEHDVNNRQIRAEYADGESVTTTYTASGQVDTQTDSRGVTDFDYDAQDRLTRISYPTGAAIEYTYDQAGNRTGLITANQAIVYGFDALNRLSIVDNGQGITTYHYDAVGNRQAIDHANGTRTDYTYDDLNRLLEVTHRDPLGTPFSRQTYTLGLAGNRLSMTELDGRVVDYSYDDLYRLTSETVTDPARGNRTTSWTHDAVGNRLTQIDDGILTQYDYDANDRLVEETTGGQATTYTYDANGNTSEKRIDGLLEVAYDYDSRDRLARADAPAATLEYTYDATGIRQSKTENGVRTNFLVDPNRDFAQVIEERDATTALEVAYLHGDDLLNQTRGGLTHTYHADGLGSTRALSDITGIPTDGYLYTAYGELEHHDGLTDNDFLFTGEQFDPGLGFYYLRARYYDPAVGRFPTMDTFQGRVHEPQTLHKYLYVHADPVNNIDPSGNITLGGLVTRLNLSVGKAILSVRAGFSVSSTVGGSALRNLGIAVERSASLVLRKTIGSSGAVRSQIRLVGQGGRRILDFWAQVGNRVAILEAKFGLPSRAGPALTRLVGQIRTAQTSQQAAREGAQVVLWTFKAPSNAQMQLLLRNLGADATGVQLVNGLVGLAQWARFFFLL